MQRKTSSILICFVALAVSSNFALAACPPADLNGDCLVNFLDFCIMALEGNLLDLRTMASHWLESGEDDADGEILTLLGRVDIQADELDSFAVEFVVVDKKRVDRSVFEYECEVILKNISAVVFENVQLGMVSWPDNMTIIDPHVSFGDAEIGPGESATSIDTCTFTVDRSVPINPVEIIWHYITEDMVRIPAGTFLMGDHFNEGNPRERPVHSVYLDSFYMGKYETTNRQYCDYLNSAYPGQIKVVSGIVYAASDSGNSYPYCDTHSYDTDSQIDFSDPDFSVRTKDGRDMSDDPMVEVSWYGAVAYCNLRSGEEGKELCYNLSTWDCDFSKKGYRLATEAEWEYAARGGLSGRRFPWGDTISHSQGNYYSNSDYSYDISPTRGFHPTWNDGVWPYTSSVGAFAANGYGLYDMAGNVWEWCNDWLSSSYYSSIPTNNPTGPISGTFRILRGGCWISSARIANRRFTFPDISSEGSGIRIVLDLEPDLSQVSTPIIAPNGGSFTNSVSVSLSCDTTGATIRYTTNGTAPTSSSIVYSSPFTLTSSATVKARAFKSGYANSHVASAAFTVGFGMVWVHIDDPGVPGHEGFNGYMSKYETTNAQYCEFLNAALASGDIYVSDEVYGSNGSNSGADFVGERYYYIAGSGGTYNGATNGGAARINFTGSSFTVDSGFENHPVTRVSWYGSRAFCNYYGWRLPTEWEWQAVADHEGEFNYGCGPIINNNIANYRDSTHPDGTTVAGSFGTYGYGMCDMAGNVEEWTDSWYNSTNRVLRGGDWHSRDHYCTVSFRSLSIPYNWLDKYGFRVCRDTGPELVAVPDVTGLSHASAESAIVMAGLAVGTVSETFSDTVIKDHVISQTPSGGDSVTPGSMVNLVVSKGPDLSRVSTPIIAPNGGSFTNSVSVSLTCDTTGATIRYTTNGTAPTSSSIVYSSPFTLTSSAPVKAQAFKSGHTNSHVAYATFIVGATTKPSGMVWVHIDDPGVPGHEGFNGEMSKYKTTNAEYCEFLNVALASGDIYVSGNKVYGSNGSNSGADFVGEIYFDTYAADSHSQISYGRGTFRVRSRDGYSMANHPVVEVSWYGATAFCNYYGYRLPTEWEWQAVADYDGSYTYGCGTSINSSNANYYLGGGNYCNPLNLSSVPYTSPVDHYSSYGYGMNDMAGNVWEWTGSLSPSYNSDDRVVRGGSWYYDDYGCTVSVQYSGPPSFTNADGGFRVCR